MFSILSSASAGSVFRYEVRSETDLICLEVKHNLRTSLQPRYLHVVGASTKDRAAGRSCRAGLFSRGLTSNSMRARFCEVGVVVGVSSFEPDQRLTALTSEVL